MISAHNAERSRSSIAPRESRELRNAMREADRYREIAQRNAIVGRRVRGCLGNRAANAEHERAATAPVSFLHESKVLRAITEDGLEAITEDGHRPDARCAHL